MSTAPSAPKICVICKQDVSGKPRTKDQHGRYACKACLTARDAAQARETPLHAGHEDASAPADVGAYGVEGADDPMANLLAQEAAASTGVPCPRCSRALPEGATTCAACGFDSKVQARDAKRAQRREKRERVVDASGKPRSGMGDTAGAGVMLAAIGALIGGVIGGAIWAAVAYHLHRESGWIAWGVGAACGVGAAAGARGYAGNLTGAVAAGIALLSVAGGKYATIRMIVDDVTKSISTHASDNEIVAHLADDIVRQREQKGEKLAWPEGVDPEDASEAKDYPPDVWKEAQEQWAAYDDAGRQQWRQSEDARRGEAIARVKSVVAQRGFVEMLSPFDFLWGLLAVASAFRIGSGRGDGD